MSRDPRTLTVAKLIELLQKLPPSAFVMADGCDCVGEALDACVYGDGEVLISRSPPDPIPTDVDAKVAAYKQGFEDGVRNDFRFSYPLESPPEPHRDSYLAGFRAGEAWARDGFRAGEAWAREERRKKGEGRP